MVNVRGLPYVISDSKPPTGQEKGGEPRKASSKRSLAAVTQEAYPIITGQEGGWERMSKAARRRPLLMASVMVALVAACIAALVIVSMRLAEAAFPGRNGAIAFTDHFEVHRVQPDGTRATPLADQLGYSQTPTFSADGKKIAFQNDEDDIDDIPRDLWVMGADGENQTNITNTPNVDEWHPSWFPSGRKIAYSGAYSGNFRNFNIEVATLDESGKVVRSTRLLTSSEDYPLGLPDPSVSP